MDFNLLYDLVSNVTKCAVYEWVWFWYYEVMDVYGFHTNGINGFSRPSLPYRIIKKSDLPLYTLSKEKDTIFFLNKFNRLVFFVDFDSQRFDQLIIITYLTPRYS